MDDPYQFAETMNQKTLNYVKMEKERFTVSFGRIDDDLKKTVTEYATAQRIIQALVRGSHLVTMYIHGQEYHVAIDGRAMYSTENVISWIEASKDCRRIAVFETVGSDNGFLKLFFDEKPEKVIADKISQIVFTDSSYYLVKTFSEKGPPDGGELNSHRVMLEGNVVFGQGLGSNDFIEIHPAGDRVSLSVGDWNHSSLFEGMLEDPSTWKRAASLESPAVPLGFREKELCYLEKSGNGIIKTAGSTLLEGANPIEDCVMVKDGFLAFELSDAKIQPVLYDFEGNEKERYSFETPMGLVNTDSDGTNAAAVLKSFGIPYALYRYENGRFTRKEQCVALNVSVMERKVRSGDVMIHYFLAGTRDRDDRKAIITGYGGYNISWLPDFDPLLAALMKNGVTLVVPNLRGGGEYGEAWHLAGTRERKQNVFDDFIAVIGNLKKEGYRVVATGQSNGGLLVGSVVTQRPELLDGAKIGVPVLDMMRFHHMSVGKYWITEYGNPDDPADAAFLLKYSPYHNIKPVSYPPVMLFSRLKDDRVHPAHAIKFHMKLSENTDNAYLRVNQGGGHAGVPLQQKIEELCEEFNFVTRCLKD